MSSSVSRYAPAQIGLHWLIFVLFAFNFIVSDNMGRALKVKLEGGIPDQFAALVHPPVGVAVLVLTLIRLVVRWRKGAPALPPNGKPLMDRAAQVAHIALYALLVMIPLSGIAAWGLGIRPAGDVHGIVVKLAVWLVALHALAALYHQFVLKDGLLDRMRPKRG